MTDAHIRELVASAATAAGVNLPSNWDEEYARVAVLLVDYNGDYQLAKDGDKRAIIAKTKAVLDMAKGDRCD